ncbi:MULTISPECIES: IclR family transcriptional regulator [Serratia]|jgi:DNA-binding IclR family transcriptional regulator|uniref:IclR family transcriptional regulator n=1 Tax=Serratia liquefaciens TaxID=614 RepID=A0A515CYN7_SERLI|nr:IclR family transcriptional regulator [Serratia liquefaciens]MBI6161079.1 IclR family transcriptional regulator [Serratia liquefaciens]MBV0840787.1 IclR family transcriptional regulator [Serratia liquefaciens]OKP25005.1 transcriptional regulator [Serratia liquefaciens]QDL33279.1 IclR family transcriptional regulator [Serratia liquefaciens]QQU54148.1 IclR family transcriptional regulator [Serratia liquefaciens]
MSEPSMSCDDEKAGGIQVITRAAKILDALGEKPNGMSLGEIAQAVDLPRSTVQRIVNALDSVQLVRGGVGGVRLGPSLLRLIARVHTEVVAIAEPWLQALSDATGETVSLARASGLQLAIVHYIVADRELRVVPRIGMNLPLYSTSGGRALLALDSDDAARELLGEAYKAVTDLTIRDFPALLEHLTEIRRTGLAYDREETLEGISMMAVAIDTILGRFSISLLVPSTRFTKNEADYREEILKCKEALLDEIGKVITRD